MRYKTRDIGEGGIDLRVAITEAWLAAECKEASVGLAPAGMTFEGRLEAAGQGYLLRGTLRGELLVPCARCLEPAPVVVDAPMTTTFVEASVDADGDAEVTREAGRLRRPRTVAGSHGNPPRVTMDTQDDVVAFEHGIIDLGRPLRDEILLAVPMGPVCRPECAGICPTCGRNRNVTPCDCERSAGENAKLGALAKIKLR